MPYTSSQICKEFGISRKTLYMWERLGIIPRALKNAYGFNDYDKTHVQAISKRIRWLKGKGYKTGPR